MENDGITPTPETSAPTGPATPVGTPAPARDRAARPSQGDVLVLGATGKTGRRVLDRLRSAGTAVRGVSRTAATPFDWTRPETWSAAVAGASALYLVPPDDPAPTSSFVTEAVGAGVRRIVALSGRGAETFDEAFGAGMVAGEEAARASGAEWTILRPNNFFQNFDEDLWREPLRGGRLALPIGDVSEPFIDADDIAAVAVAALTEAGHEGRVYELSGPRGLTFAEVAETVGRLTGRSVRFERLTPQEYRSELLAQGFPEEAADALGAMFALHRAGHTAEPADGVQRALGREPRDFEDWARRVARSGAWSPTED